ncbi:hypothetical protein FEDK69T_12130 [Flavobacterium enshiense DK69]|uniref:Uncharacterized protein n=1 Tax=Flavobacterium enshiense DK69 TaxID=1107311 RepID=V6SC31_9FLAO|nr:hypothetical protein [Flavobacterium enshiense]ESU23802.1 hypothetical protein FEDK69T_12130 [Flavobacterium enshiense DK69]KGO96068.1 hypothetical protein Q767_07340 [Flavobacterium enshiense DK69]
MTENFTINVIWKKDRIDYVLNLNSFSKDVFETYSYNTRKSNENKIVFSIRNLGKMLIKKCAKALIIMLIKFLFVYIFIELKVELIPQVLLISLLLDVFSIIRIPFTTVSSVIFNQDSKRREIIIQTIFPIFSDSLLVTSPERPISRIVFSQKNDYTYVTFRRKQNDVIPETAPILVINSNDKEQLLETENFLKSFIDGIEGDISIVKL